MPNLSEQQHYALASAWNENIQKGIAAKAPFLKQYRDARRYAFESHDFIFDELNMAMKTTVPKAWEMLSIFGPLLAFKEPLRTGRVRFPRPDQESGMDPREPFAKVSQDLLNYQAHELKLKRHARTAVDESILAAGVTWLEEDPLTGLVGHFSDSILNLVIDPDAETMDDAWWIARRHRMPRWEVAELFGMKVDDDRIPSGGTMSDRDLETGAKSIGSDTEDENADGSSNEILDVWEIWSRMGIGFRGKQLWKSDHDPKGKESGYGDHCHFYVIKSANQLFNVSNDWPIPLYMDNEWPCSLLYYRKEANKLWPTSVMAPALGLQKAIDWMATMILTKIRTTSRDFIATLKSLDEDIQEKVRTGGDLEVLYLNSSDVAEGKGVRQLIDFLQAPPMNTDVWRVWEMCNDLFEKASGLYAALYGQSGPTQARSARETEARETRADLRPSDMREAVEDWHTEMARKEMVAMRWLYEPAQVGEILGEEAAEIWGDYQEGDLMAENGGRGRIMREYDFRIEASSTARPDIHKEREDQLELFDRAMQVCLNVGDLNAANNLLMNVQESFQIPENKRIFIQPPPPQPDPGDELKAQIEELKLQGEQFRLQGEQLKVQIEQLKVEKAMVDVQKAKVDAEAKAAEGGPEPAERLAEAMLESANPKEVIAIRNGEPVRASDS